MVQLSVWAGIGKICDTLNHGQFVFSLALGKIIGELQGELKQFAPPKEEKVRLAGQTGQSHVKITW